MIAKIILGGQTGADQAALDVAIEMYIPHGRWVPKGRETEAGRLPDKYHMQKISSISYGLVGADKILFSLLPEIALPIDNTQWLKLFKTCGLRGHNSPRAEEIANL